MCDWIRLNWCRLREDLRHSPTRQYLSPAEYTQYQVVLPLTQRYLSGKMIDLGCGDMPFRDFLTDRVTTYHSLDIQPYSDEVTFVGDIREMSMIASASYDSAICLEVLEHIPNPFQAVREIYRILRPGGTVIISVPHLSRLHEVPHDYFRFTGYGLHYMLESTGFEVLETQENGSLFSFLGHQISTLFLSAMWPIPVLQQGAWFLNKWFITLLCYKMDQVFNLGEVFAMGYVGVARKPCVVEA